MINGQPRWEAPGLKPLAGGQAAEARAQFPPTALSIARLTWARARAPGSDGWPAAVSASADAAAHLAGVAQSGQD